MDVRQEDLVNERPLNLFYLRLAQTLFVYNLFLGVVLCPHARGQLSGRIAWINRPSGPWRSLLRCSRFCLAFCIFPFPSEIWFWHIWFFKIVYCVCVCACLHMAWHRCGSERTACWCQLPPSTLAPGDQTHIDKLDSEHLHLLSHLASSVSIKF